MARHRRIVRPGIPHHVMHRGNDRRRLCSFASDYWRLLSLIADASARHGCVVHGFALMSNHLHIIVTPTDAALLPAFVKRFAQGYAVYRNRKRKGSGKLFEERYLSFPLPSDDDVAAATAYVDLNPVDAGLVAVASAHRWSTARVHLGNPPPPDWPNLWTPSDWYRALGSTVEKRADAYREWLGASQRREPSYVAQLRKAERCAGSHYTLRLERPNRTRAA